MTRRRGSRRSRERNKKFSVVALFGFAERPLLLTPFATDTRHFHRLQSAAAGLDYSAREPNFTLALATLSAEFAAGTPA